jgi:hypothetical protein
VFRLRKWAVKNWKKLISDLLEGSFDCVRVVLNAYLGMGQSGGGMLCGGQSIFQSGNKPQSELQFQRGVSLESQFDSYAHSWNKSVWCHASAVPTTSPSLQRRPTHIYKRESQAIPGSPSTLCISKLRHFS